jgi:hypothetical protein
MWNYTNKGGGVILKRPLKSLTRSGGKVYHPPAKWAHPGDLGCYQKRRICSLNLL